CSGTKSKREGRQLRRPSCFYGPLCIPRKSRSLHTFLPESCQSFHPANP
ncbi:MAG: hypothetical protein AVDCRST_MAG56-3154, partial [uncultured Cytophagales bacterium]